MTSYVWAIGMVNRCGAHDFTGNECDRIIDHYNDHASRNDDGSINSWWPRCHNRLCNHPGGHVLQCHVPSADIIDVWKERAYAENERRYAAEYRRDAAEAVLAALRAEVGKIADELSAESYVYRQIVSRLRALVTDQSPRECSTCEAWRVTVNRLAEGLEARGISDVVASGTLPYHDVIGAALAEIDRLRVTDQSPASPPPCGHRDYDLGTNLPVVCVAPRGHPISKHRFEFADVSPTSDTRTNGGQSI